MLYDSEPTILTLKGISRDGEIVLMPSLVYAASGCSTAGERLMQLGDYAHPPGNLDPDRAKYMHPVVAVALGELGESAANVTLQRPLALSAAQAVQRQIEDYPFPSTLERDVYTLCYRASADAKTDGFGVTTGPYTAQLGGRSFAIVDSHAEASIVSLSPSHVFPNMSYEISLVQGPIHEEMVPIGLNTILALRDPQTIARINCTGITEEERIFIRDSGTFITGELTAGTYSICLAHDPTPEDLTTPALYARSDMYLSGFRLQVLAKLEVGWDIHREKHVRLEAHAAGVLPAIGADTLTLAPQHLPMRLQMVWSLPAATGVRTVPFEVQPVVRAVSVGGDPSTPLTDSVRLFAESDECNPSLQFDRSLQPLESLGVAIAPLINGTATFRSLHIDTSGCLGKMVSLRAEIVPRTGNGLAELSRLAPVDSMPFLITHDEPMQLVLRGGGPGGLAVELTTPGAQCVQVDEPGAAAIGAVVHDAYGSLVPGYAAPVEIEVCALRTAAEGGVDDPSSLTSVGADDVICPSPLSVLEGVWQLEPSDGLVRFEEFSLTTRSDRHVLALRSGTLEPVFTLPFTACSLGVADAWTWLQQPSATAVAMEPFDTQPVLALRDGEGNVLSTPSLDAVLALGGVGARPRGPALELLGVESGVSAQMRSDNSYTSASLYYGTARFVLFSELAISAAGSYTLVASHPTLPYVAISTEINVSPGEPAALRIGVSQSSDAQAVGLAGWNHSVAGEPISPDLTVEVIDSASNVVSDARGDKLIILLLPGQTVEQAASAQANGLRSQRAAQGVASFVLGTFSDASRPLQLRVWADGLPMLHVPEITLTPAPPAALSILSEPPTRVPLSTDTERIPFDAGTVVVTDRFGNGACSALMSAAECDAHLLIHAPDGLAISLVLEFASEPDGGTYPLLTQTRTTTRAVTILSDGNLGARFDGIAAYAAGAGAYYEAMLVTSTMTLGGDGRPSAASRVSGIPTKTPTGRFDVFAAGMPARLRWMGGVARGAIELDADWDDELVLEAQDMRGERVGGLQGELSLTVARADAAPEATPDADAAASIGDELFVGWSQYISGVRLLGLVDGRATLSGIRTRTQQASANVFVAHMAANVHGRQVQLEAARSEPFGIVPSGSAQALAWATQPPRIALSDATLVVQPILHVVDVAAARISSGTHNVTLSLVLPSALGGNGGDAASLLGPRSVLTSQGIATFAHVGARTSASLIGARLRADAPGLYGAVSDAFEVYNASVATSLAFADAPVDTVREVGALWPPLTVRFLSAGGGLVVDHFTSNVHLCLRAVASDAPPVATGCTASDPLHLGSAVAYKGDPGGVASFDALAVSPALYDAAGGEASGPFYLEAAAEGVQPTAEGMPAALSEPALRLRRRGVAARLSFLDELGELHGDRRVVSDGVDDLDVGVALPTVSVQLTDVQGNHVNGTDAATTLSLEALSADPGGDDEAWQLVGPSSVTLGPANGSGTLRFDALSLRLLSGGTRGRVRLRASVQGGSLDLLPDTSDAFELVRNGAPFSLRFAEEPPHLVQQGHTMQPPPAASVRDLYGRPVAPSLSEALRISVYAVHGGGEDAGEGDDLSAGAAQGATQQTAAETVAPIDGSATFATLNLTKLGATVLVAHAPGLLLARSRHVVVLPTPAQLSCPSPDEVDHPVGRCQWAASATSGVGLSPPAEEEAAAGDGDGVGDVATERDHDPSFDDALYNASTVIGPPDMDGCGRENRRRAWRPYGSAPAWILVRFPLPVIASGVVIVQSGGYGGVVAVALRDEHGNETQIFDASRGHVASGADCVHSPFVLSFAPTPARVNALWVRVDEAASDAAPQIDAVMLVEAAPLIDARVNPFRATLEQYGAATIRHGALWLTSGAAQQGGFLVRAPPPSVHMSELEGGESTLEMPLAFRVSFELYLAQIADGAGGEGVCLCFGEHPVESAQRTLGDDPEAEGLCVSIRPHATFPVQGMGPRPVPRATVEARFDSRLANRTAHDDSAPPPPHPGPDPACDVYETAADRAPYSRPPLCAPVPAAPPWVGAPPAPPAGPLQVEIALDTPTADQRAQTAGDGAPLRLELTISSEGFSLTVDGARLFELAPLPQVWAPSPSWGFGFAARTGAPHEGASSGAMDAPISPGGYRVDNFRLERGAAFTEGVVPLLVSPNGQQYASDSAGRFSYHAQPVLSSLAPLHGPSSEATAITLRGHAFEPPLNAASEAEPSHEYVCRFQLGTDPPLETAARFERGAVRCETPSAVHLQHHIGSWHPHVRAAYTPNATYRPEFDVRLRLFRGGHEFVAGGAPHTFTLLPPPVLVGVGPQSGPVHGGTILTIEWTLPGGLPSPLEARRGCRFSALHMPVETGVLQEPAAVAATRGEGEDDLAAISTIRCISPQSPKRRDEAPSTPLALAAAVAVSLNGASFDEAASAAHPFEFYEPPAVYTVTPTVGPLLGGTPLTVTGTNLSGGSNRRCGFAPIPRGHVSASRARALRESFLSVAASVVAGSDALLCETPRFFGDRPIDVSFATSYVEVSLNGQQFSASDASFDFVLEATDYLYPSQLRTGECLAPGVTKGSLFLVDCEMLARLQSPLGRETPGPRSVYVD